MENPFEREMEIARQIQASPSPAELPQFPGWEIAACFQPARHVASDFYDAFPLIQNRRLGLGIGDVCDKGVGAALFMAQPVSTAAELLDRIQASVQEYIGGADPSDDITLLAVRRQ